MEQETDTLFGICPYVTTQRLFSGKWSLLIMEHLAEGTLRFGELRRRLGSITQATLAKELKALEGYGLITRKVYGTIPPRVDYSLSETGTLFLPVSCELKRFGESYIARLKPGKTP